MDFMSVFATSGQKGADFKKRWPDGIKEGHEASQVETHKG